MSGTIINAKNPSNVYQALNVDASGRLECSVNEIEITAGDISVAVDGLEGLQTITNTKLQNIHDRQDDILTSNNATKLSVATTATKITSLESTNHTDLGNIHSRQDDILTASNAIKLSVASMDTDLSAHKTSTNTHLGNIHSRQDDILTASNATKLSVASMDTDLAAHKTSNNSNLVNIYNRQDDILTASNATKLSVASIDTDLAAHKTSNNSNLVNIYNRQDDILTSTNAVKTNTQSLENCVASNKVNVNISSGNISGFATEDTLASLLSSSQILSEDFTACDTGAVVISSSALPSGAATQSTLNDAEVHLGNIETSVQLIDDVVGTDNSTGPTKCISIGGTNPLSGNIQEIAVDSAGHLSVDILSSALPSGAATDLASQAIASKLTLATTAEVKELLSGVTINAGALSSEFDTENYERIRFFGETNALLGLANIAVFGSNVSGGTFYNLGEVLTGLTTASTHYAFGKFENLPRFIKIFNTHGSTNFTFTKLYLQGSGGRLGV